MKQEVIDKFMADMQELNNKINSVPSPTLQAIMWLKSLEELLKPIWQDGYNEGLTEGRKQKSSVIIKKLTNEN